MRTIILRRGETNWALADRYTGSTDALLTANGRREALVAAAARARSARSGATGGVQPRLRAVDTATLAVPECDLSIDPLVAEYDYGDDDGLTSNQIARRTPGCDIWRRLPS